MLQNFDFERSKGTSFDYNISDQADYFTYFQGPRRCEEHGLLSTRPIFEAPEAGRFALATGSEALGTGWKRSIDCPPPIGETELRLQRDGTLNRGAYQDYGLTQVPDLEAQTSKLLAEIASGV